MKITLHDLNEIKIAYDKAKIALLRAEAAWAEALLEISVERNEREK